MVICFRLSGVLWVRMLIMNYLFIFIVQIRLLVVWLYICIYTHTHTYISYNAFSYFWRMTCVSLALKYWFETNTYLHFTFLIFSLISLPLFFVCTIKRYRFCWHLNALENCPNVLRAHNFKLDCVTTFLERAGRKWRFTKQFLCAVFLFLGCFTCQFISV